MSNNGKDTRNISRIIYSLINGEELNMHKTVWCEGGLKLSDIVTKNGREYELNTILGYIMVRLDNWNKKFTRGVIRYRIILSTM